MGVDLAGRPLLYKGRFVSVRPPVGGFPFWLAPPSGGFRIVVAVHLL